MKGFYEEKAAVLPAWPDLVKTPGNYGKLGYNVGNSFNPIMASSAAEKFSPKEEEIPLKPRARRSVIQTPREVPLPPEMKQEKREAPLPPNVERMDADGSWATWDVRKGTGKNAEMVFLSADRDTRHVLAVSRAEYEIQQEAMEHVKKLEKYWAAFFDIATEGNEAQAEFFTKNKGRILEIAARMARKFDLPENMAVAMAVADVEGYKEPQANGNVKPVDYTRILANTVNAISQDLFVETEDEEDTKLRESAKLAHAISASKRALEGKQLQETGAESQVDNIILDYVGDIEALEVLVDGKINPEIKESTEAVKSASIEDNKAAMEMLRAGTASVAERIAMKDKVVENVKNVRSVQVREVEPVDEVRLGTGEQQYPAPTRPREKVSRRAQNMPMGVEAPLPAAVENREPTNPDWTPVMQENRDTAKAPPVRRQTPRPPKKPVDYGGKEFADTVPQVQSEEEKPSALAKLGSTIFGSWWPGNS